MNFVSKIISIIYAFGIFLTITSLNSCETDVSLKGEKENIPVIYGLLDATKTRHYIKINRMYLIDGDVYSVAKVRDSLEFENLEAKIDEVNLKGNITRSWKLKETVLSNKEVGDFYAPDHTIYYFDAPDIKGNYTYRITIKNGSNTATAETNIIDHNGVADAAIFQSFYWKSPTLAMVVNDEDGIKTFKNKVIYELRPPKNTKTVQLNMYFPYQNHFADRIENDTIKLVLGTKEVKDPTEPTELNFEVTPEKIFQNIGAGMDDITEVAGLQHRIICRFFYEVVCANDELTIYAETSDPDKEQFQSKTEYTNITNGLGIFASRGTYDSYDNPEIGSKAPLFYKFDAVTYDAFIVGSVYTTQGELVNYTGNKGFIDSPCVE